MSVYGYYSPEYLLEILLTIFICCRYIFKISVTRQSKNAIPLSHAAP